MLLLVGTESLLVMFLSLEMTSIPLYLLAGFQKKSAAGAEAALKYFLVGGVSSAVLLFGLSLIYGVSGAMTLGELARFIASGTTGEAAARAAWLDPLFLTGVVMALGGFAFKVAAVPFHLWAPDVYEGAPTPTAAFIASGSKIAAFFILAKFLAMGLGDAGGNAAWGGFQPGWLPALAFIALASMVAGNLAALRQRNVKRLLAWSAVAQAGYLLVGLLAAGGGDRWGADRATALTSVLFYTIVYGFTTLGAFGVCQLVEARRGGARLDDFEGLHKECPALALCLAVFMVSLAGIPPLAGFVGKFYLFAGALATSNGPQPGAPGLLWVVIVALAMNAVSLYYYLIVLKHAFIMDTEKPLEKATAQAEPLCPADAPCAGRCQRTSLRLAFACIALLAVGILALGMCPNLLLKPIQKAALLTVAPAVLPVPQ
jgi:NADH-quinone oxidoreductase subunit N